MINQKQKDKILELLRTSGRTRITINEFVQLVAANSEEFEELVKKHGLAQAEFKEIIEKN